MKKIAALLAGIAILLSITAAPATATGNDNSWLRFWEFQDDDIFGNPTLAGDNWYTYKVDNGSLPNLNNIDFNLWLGCDGGQNDWNNCISGFTYNIVAGSCVRFYDATNYSQGLFTEKGPKTGSYGLSSAYENKITSIRWGDWKYDPVGENYRCYQGAYD